MHILEFGTRAAIWNAYILGMRSVIARSMNKSCGVRVRRDPQCPKRDPHLWSGRGALKHLLVGVCFLYWPKASERVKVAQRRLCLSHTWQETRSANVATTTHQPKLVNISLLCTSCIITYGLYSHRCSKQMWLLHNHLYPEVPLCLAIPPLAVLTSNLWQTPHPPVKDADARTPLTFSQFVCSSASSTC